jgi:hypothetical protein
MTGTSTIQCRNTTKCREQRGDGICRTLKHAIQGVISS